MSKIVLVTGATGGQGGAVARELLKAGHTVRALVRDPAGERAVALEAAGAELVRGDMTDLGGLRAAMAGADAVFAVTTPFVDGIEAEVLQGKTMVDAAVAAGVGHFVFSSVASADEATGIPHFDSKFAVEEHLRATDLDWTITAPVYFNDNLSGPWNVGAIAGGLLRQALPADLPLQTIPLSDLGRFNAHVIGNPERYVGRRIDIASSEMTGPAMAAALGKGLGRDVVYEEQPVAEVYGMSEDLGLMYDWFAKNGYSVDIAGLRAEAPEVEWTDFDAWVADARPAFEAAS